MNYQGNSNKQREAEAAKGEKKAERPTLEPVVVGKVIRKNPIRFRLRNTFFGGDFKNTTRFVASEVLLPALRNLIVDAATNSIERYVYGETRGSRSLRRPEFRSYVQYNSSTIPGRTATHYANLPDQPSRRLSQRSADYGQIILTSSEDASLVVERMLDIIDKYGVVTVAELMELLDQPISVTDPKWGWTYLNNVRIRQVRDGFLIDLPAAEPV